MEKGSSTSLASAKRAIALLVATLLLILASFYLVKPSFGAEATSRKDTLSTAAPSANANHTILFTSAAADAWDPAETLIVEIDVAGTAFNLTGLVAADIDILDDGVNKPVLAACDATVDDISFSLDTTADTLTFTNCAGSAIIAGGSVITIRVGTNAVNDGAGVNQIDNPAKVAAPGTADTYKIGLSGTSAITGETVVAIQDDVTVSVTIDEYITFTIAGLASGSCTGDTGTPTAVTTTATTVPYATVSTEAFYVGCQNLTLSTNAASGYVVTGQENTSLKAGTTLISDGNCDGTCTEVTGTAWATATNNGLAQFCENITSTPCSTAGDTTAEYRNFACRGVDADCDPGTGNETAQNILSKAAAASGDVGKVHYKLSVDATQAQGSYSNLVTYIATPTF